MEGPGAAVEADPEAIADRLDRSLDWVRSMLVDRRGESPDAVMVTRGLHAVAADDRAVRCDGALGLTDAGAARGSTLDAVAPGRPFAPPPHRIVRARWGPVGGGGDEPRVAREANVLGSSVLFGLDDDATAIEVPVVDAEPATLGAYGATLVEAGDVVTFGGDGFPIWVVDYGRRYVDDHLLTDRGGGFYLEWHTDRPHWHQPLSPDAGGFYLLARRIGRANDDERGDAFADYHLTGFRIPLGFGVHTAPGAIHCDAALVGTWAVGYADSTDFSTAMVRNRVGGLVAIRPD
jgi:hypothetical protein